VASKFKVANTRVYIVYIVLLCICLFISACSSLQPNYPIAWPKPISTKVDIVTTLDGFYECIGEVVTGRPVPDSDKAYLTKDRATRFLFDTTEQPKDCSVVSLKKKGDDLIEITAYSGEEAVGKLTIQKDINYSVENNWVNLRKTHHVASGGGVIMDSSTIQNSLTINEAGDLIIKSKTYGFGVVYFVPYGNDEYYWVRFKKAR